MPRAGRRRAAAALTSVVVGVVALSGCAGPAASPHPAQPDAGVQLFQRPWTSIATECAATIGPAGFAWVLTSPPQEHITGSQWWTSYQPVSYTLDSKLGTADEFAAMVDACNAAGVKVVVDAVINHMAGIDDGTGFAGTPFSHDDYPGLYTAADFHHCALTADDDISDYSSREQVQTCELSNLADLDTSSPTVRSTIASYLNGLLDLGVTGFRIDAAKHMAADDVAAIVEMLPKDTMIVSETIRGGAAEAVQPEEYTSIGRVLEFQYARDLSPQVEGGVLSDPLLEDPRPSHVASKDAVVFIDNHDTERGEASLTYRDRGRYLLANALMLADDYGTPLVYSGYAFTDNDAGAPQDDTGHVIGWTCDGVTGPHDAYDDGDGVCTEAWTAVAGMLEFRAYAGDAPRLPGVGDGTVYGFEREARGILLVNPSNDADTVTVRTGLPDGEYCDVISGGRAAAVDGGCRGTALIVDHGELTAAVPGIGALAIHVGDRP